MKISLRLFLLGWFSLQTAFSQPKSSAGLPTITISGYVREAGSQEALIGVNVYQTGTSTDRFRPDRAGAPERRPGTTTNTYRFYSLTLPIGPSA